MKSRNQRPLRTLTSWSLKTGIVCSLLFASGCGSKRIVFVDGSFESTDVVRLADDVKGHVYFPTPEGGWEKSSNKVTLPEGWYAIPLTSDD